LGRAEAECARVADVELDQLASCRLEGMGSPVELTSDLVADFRQSLAHGKRFFGGRHGRARRGGVGSGMVSEITAPGASPSEAGRSFRAKRPSAATAPGGHLGSCRRGPIHQVALDCTGRALQCAPMTSPEPDYPTLQRIGWPWAGPPADPAWQALFERHPEGRPARVSEQHRTGYALSDAPDTVPFRVESPPEWQRRPVFTADGVPLHERAAVGDWVLHDGRRILALLPRRTAIKRAAAGEHYQQ